jgi:glycosyltransferase involved in cell wall biosynthesis
MSTRYRILHLLPDLVRGGGQVVALELVAHADTSRFEMHVASLRPPDDLRLAFERAGAECFQVSSVTEVLAALALARQIRDRRIDLLHVHSDPDRRVGQLAALLTGTPVVGHLHSPWAHLQPMYSDRAGPLGKASAALKARLRRAVERKVVKHYVAAGAQVAAFHADLVDAPITIANNGVDVSRFTPVTADSRRRGRSALGIGHDVRLLVCVGRLAPGKGQDELVRLLASVPGAVLLLIGDGGERTALSRQAEALGVSDRVILAGEREDVSLLLRAADLFVLASVSEGLPISVLEAMACEIPVVAYDLPGLRDVITDGRDGCLVTLGDREALASVIRDLLEDESSRATLGNAARETVMARFDARHMARDAEAAYDVVLGNEPLDSRRSGGDRLVTR